MAVANVELSLDAEADMLDIGEYTLREWGVRQTDKYMDALEDCFVLLARNPGLGRPCPDLQPGLQRFERKKHVIFYMVNADGIFIVRILHERTLPEAHSFSG